MSLKCGIVGLPNSGKSTLFNALTGNRTPTENFPYTTKESLIGSVTIPDKRLYAISDIVQPKKIIPNSFEIIDIAGLAKGASEGEGLGNRFLDSIRHSDAIIHVVRCFDDENIVHVNNAVDPVKDIREVDLELQFKDYETIEKVYSKTEKISQAGDKNARLLMPLFDRIKEQLEKEKAIRDMSFTPEEQKAIKGYSFLTSKKVLYVANVKENDIAVENNHVVALKKEIQDHNSELLILSAKLESEISELESREEKEEYLHMYGLETPAINRLITSAYKLLDMITFFTAGPKEVRAWSIRKGIKAPEAAGTIHSDFERGFIRAEMIKHEDFLKLKSEQACKDAAKFHVVGKDYVVEDGDMMHFRFNV
jgi:ribosome-binding ATPase